MTATAARLYSYCLTISCALLSDFHQIHCSTSPTPPPFMWLDNQTFDCYKQHSTSINSCTHIHSVCMHIAHAERLQKEAHTWAHTHTQFPTLIGFILSLIQLSLFCVYPSNKKVLTIEWLAWSLHHKHGLFCFHMYMYIYSISLKNIIIKYQNYTLKCLS